MIHRFHLHGRMWMCALEFGLGSLDEEHILRGSFGCRLEGRDVENPHGGGLHEQQAIWLGQWGVHSEGRVKSPSTEGQSGGALACGLASAPRGGCRRWHPGLPVPVGPVNILTAIGVEGTNAKGILDEDLGSRAKGHRSDASNRGQLHGRQAQSASRQEQPVRGLAHILLGIVIRPGRWAISRGAVAFNNLGGGCPARSPAKPPWGVIILVV